MPYRRTDHPAACGEEEKLCCTLDPAHLRRRTYPLVDLIDLTGRFAYEAILEAG